MINNIVKIDIINFIMVLYFRVTFDTIITRCYIGEWPKICFFF